MISYFDIVGLILMLFLALRAMSRGFVQEVLTLGAFFGGIIVAVLFSGSVARIISPWIEERIWGQIVAFLLIFVAFYIIINILHRATERALEAIRLVNADRALGFCFGIIEGGAIILVCILVIQITPFVNVERILKDSLLARVALPFVPTLLEALGR